MKLHNESWPRTDEQAWGGCFWIVAAAVLIPFLLWANYRWRVWVVKQAMEEVAAETRTK